MQVNYVTGQQGPLRTDPTSNVYLGPNDVLIVADTEEAVRRVANTISSAAKKKRRKAAAKSRRANRGA